MLTADRCLIETLQWQLEQFFVDDVLYTSTVATPCLAQFSIVMCKVCFIHLFIRLYSTSAKGL